MDGDELRPVRERRLDLHVVDHLGDTIHHLRARDHLRAKLHQLGDGLAVARAFEDEIGDQRDRLRRLSLTPRSGRRRATIAATEINSFPSRAA